MSIPTVDASSLTPPPSFESLPDVSGIEGAKLLPDDGRFTIDGATWTVLGAKAVRLGASRRPREVFGCEPGGIVEVQEPLKNGASTHRSRSTFVDLERFAAEGKSMRAKIDHSQRADRIASDLRKAWLDAPHDQARVELLSYIRTALLDLFPIPKDAASQCARAREHSNQVRVLSHEIRNILDAHTVVGGEPGGAVRLVELATRLHGELTAWHAEVMTEVREKVGKAG